MQHVLFLCVANSARSQMAEALARSLAPTGISVYSAGSAPSRINPLAIKVLAEVGLDASTQFSKGIDAIPVDMIDTVVTLCAEEVCPVFPGSVRRVHWPLSDPASVDGTEDSQLGAFRAVRDNLLVRLASLFGV